MNMRVTEIVSCSLTVVLPNGKKKKKAASMENNVPGPQKFKTKITI